MRLSTALLLSLLTFTPPAAAQTDWHVLKTFEIGSQGAWDYLTADPATHRLYVPRTTHTMVIDDQTGAVIADIAGQQNAHGVAIAPRAGRGSSVMAEETVQSSYSISRVMPFSAR